MSKFKKGDKVRRIEEVEEPWKSRYNIKKGDVRTVSGDKSGIFKTLITLEGTGTFGWVGNKFEKVDDEIDKIAKHYAI